MQHPTWTRLLATGCVLGGMLLAAGVVRAAEEAEGEAEQEVQALDEEEVEGVDEEAVPAGPPPGVEVMRVRGRGLGDVVTEVPSSVTAFDAATIEALGAQDVSDLARVTPNVSIVQPGTQATFFIRGIGLSDFSSNAAGAVTIFQDDVAINAPAIQTGQLFDIENVDIVRGPQGSGPFRNASAGAIRVRSRRPTGNYEASLRLTRGWYAAEDDLGAHDASFQEYEGAIEVPILEDVFSSRLAFTFRDGEPWKTNGCGDLPPLDQRPTSDQRNVALLSQCGERGNYIQGFPFLGIPFRSNIPAGLPSRVGDEHNWAARGTFRLTPPETEWDVLLNAHGSRLDQQSELGQSIGTAILERGTNPELGGFGGSLPNGGYYEPDLREEYLGVDGQSGLCQRAGTNLCTNRNAQQQLADKLTERPLDIRPYRGDYDRVGQTTRDAWGGYASAEGELGDYELFLLGSYDGYDRTIDQDVDSTADEWILAVTEDEAWQTYEEVRLAGELAATPFAWELGGYFLNESLQSSGFTRIADGFGVVQRSFSQHLYSGGLWASFAWDFLDDLTLEGGVRGNYENKDFDYFIVSPGRPPRSTQQSKTWLVPTGEIILTWHIDERARAYARYTRGWKAGHYNAVAAADLDRLLAEPETNDAWEAGLSGSFWDGRVQGSGAFFYYEYNNYQVFLFSNTPGNAPTLEIVNANDAELFGVELEGQLRPLDGWVPRWLEGLRLAANFSWLQGQYIDFTTQQFFLEQSSFNSRTEDFSGNALANAPKYKVAATAEWTFELGRYGYLVPRYDMSWTDDQFFDPREGRGSSSRSPLPPLTVAQPAFFLHNLRLAYRTPTGNVEVAGWVRNLTDEVYKTYAFDVSQFSGQVINYTGQPRTVGFDVVFSF